MRVRTLGHSLRSFLLVLVNSTFMLSFSLLQTFAQNDPGPGIVPFSTQGIGNVDLATSHVQLNIPIRSKAGYASSVVGTNYFYVKACPGCINTELWEVSPGSVGVLGFQVADPTTTTLSFSTAHVETCVGGGTYSQVTANSVIDVTGASHGIHLQWYAGCNQTVSAGPVTSFDGYFTLAIVNSTPTLWDKSGNVMAMGCATTPCFTRTATDPDGNATM
jgi:hypothetical protein